jgi:hypothetical protein
MKRDNGPWYWLTVISPFLGALGSRGAGDEARTDSDRALRDLLPLWLLLITMFAVIFIFKLAGLI